MPEKLIISGVGCCLVDMLFNNIDFSGNVIKPFLSKKRGDGGLSPGHLVFAEEFEKFSGKSFVESVSVITSGKAYDKINIGGPSIVSLIHAAQVLNSNTYEVRFYGNAGNDDLGKTLFALLQKTPVKLIDFKLLDNETTPSTFVLSDPLYQKGHGERMFINSIGAAWHYMPEKIDDDFFNSNIVVFGGTALVPNIHDNLAQLLKKAKQRGCITIVNTVFDFRNEKQNPDKKWPLGKSSKSYHYIDLLIADKEEALRLSGKKKIETAIKYFSNKKISAVVITNGANPVLAYSNGKIFEHLDLTKYPVSQRIIKELRTNTNGDTTGAGDNFAGGVIATIISQIQHNRKYLNLKEAITWGIVSGGFSCFYIGGTYFESKKGEKLSKIKPYYKEYQLQIND